MAFSLTVPLTRVLVADGAFDPVPTATGRTAVAAVVAALVLLLTRQRLPRGGQWLRVAVVASGIVFGFPLLTSLALVEAPAAHGAVVIALLPAATAVVAVLRARERPGRAFWVAASLGAVAAVAFAAVQGGSFTLHPSDGLLFGAVVLGAVGYAEGGLLARELGAWQTVSWALVLGAPVTIPVTVLLWTAHPPQADPIEWAAFAYIALVSQYLGFFAWYRGLAIGPITIVSQTQLVQPILSITIAALVLREPISWWTAGAAVGVIVCAATAVRSRARPGRRDGDAQAASGAAASAASSADESAAGGSAASD